ncbi:MAG: cytochrome P450 [Myxococcales bacterium]|nr:MAG: cytochrome P450 [Myxococcales bacterium]
MMAPLFQKSHLHSYRDSIVDGIEAGLARWTSGDTIDVSAAMQELTLCISMRAFYGLPITTAARELAQMVEGFADGATSPPLLALPVDLPGMPYRAYLQSCDRLEQRLRGLIDERRARSGTHTDILSVLIEHNAGEGSIVPDSVLIGLATELFIAGHKTSASTLAWALFLLDQHPRVLESLVDELTSKLHGEAPTIDQLAELPLLDAVLRESMRLLPASPFLFFRRTTRSITLGDHELPAGASLIVSPLITHHMPGIYRDPDSFQPERWRQETTPGPYEFLPFGAGPRKCIGSAFATIALRTSLAVILQRYTLRVAPGTRVDHKVHGIIMRTKGPLPMRVGRRVEGAVVPHARVQGTVLDLVNIPAA